MQFAGVRFELSKISVFELRVLARECAALASMLMIENKSPKAEENEGEKTNQYCSMLKLA